MELDLHTKQQLANLLAEPSMVTQEHASLLENLAEVYPYYQPLHLLLAKAKIKDNNSIETLATASLYCGGNILHRVINEAESLNTIETNLVQPLPIHIENDIDVEQIDPVEDLEFKTGFGGIADEQETFDEIAEISLISNELEYTDKQDDQEVFEEIGEFVNRAISNEIKQEEETFEEILEINSSEYSLVQDNEQDGASPKEILAGDLAIENIAATDFFAFEKIFGLEELSSEESKPSTPLVEEYDQEAEAQTVSKYDDDKLPYTFLWWLAKTRKEHEQIFQPYVTPKKIVEILENSNPGELQQQYVEHIFHLQTPFSVGEETNRGPLSKLKHKGTDIIDSFIKNEPQIRPPKPEQINTENKAKKSAEDHNDLVSETLASIYIEQMLYHKAIDTYEKLSLKFPEKSRYFADLIQSLEKKI